MVGEEFVRLGEHDHSAHLARIRAAKPDVVLISLIGTDSIVFNRAFAEQGLAGKMLVWGARWTKPSCLESAPTTPKTCSAHPDISWTWPQRKTRSFRRQYEASFGRYAPPLGSVGQSNYEGLRFLETVASRAGRSPSSRCSRTR